MVNLIDHLLVDYDAVHHATITSNIVSYHNATVIVIYINYFDNSS